MPRVLIVTAHGFEDVELLYPYWRLMEEGFEVVIAAPQRGKVKGKVGYEVEAHMSFDEVKPEEFDALVLPGGRGPWHMAAMGLPASTKCLTISFAR